MLSSALAMSDLVTLEVGFVSGAGRDEAAELFWVADNGNGAETRYTEVAQGQTISQETFPGHCWLLRGKASGEVLGRFVAQDRPAVQPHEVDARRGPPADVTQGGADASPDDHAAAQDAPDAPPSAASADGGVWVSTDDVFGDAHRFERRPGARADRIEWVEKDGSGAEVAQLVQLEARVDTRWLWWTTELFKKWGGMDHG